jgi:hypothetical protein
MSAVIKVDTKAMSNWTNANTKIAAALLLRDLTGQERFLS